MQTGNENKPTADLSGHCKVSLDSDHLSCRETGSMYEVECSEEKAFFKVFTFFLGRVATSITI